MHPSRLSIDERTVEVPGTRSTWTGLRGWIREASRVGSVPRCSAAQYARCRKVYGSLEPRDIHACRDEDTLLEFSRLLANARSWPCFHRLRDHLPAEHVGLLKRETHNQLRWVRGGCIVRTKGPRFDPGRLPDDRLDTLIQRHPDLTVVESLRREKARRARDS